MVIREIKSNPKEVLNKFDWFNDYKDTRNWAMSACPEIVLELDKGYKKWLERGTQKQNEEK